MTVKVDFQYGTPVGEISVHDIRHVLRDDKAETEKIRALNFAYDLYLFLQLMKKNPDQSVIIDNQLYSLSNLVGFYVDDAGVTFHHDFQIGSHGNFRVKADKHMRIDSGQTRVPGADYSYSVFFNTKFRDNEPEFPKHVPYSQRQTTMRVAQRLRAKKRKSGACGCGGCCGGH